MYMYVYGCYSWGGGSYTTPATGCLPVTWQPAGAGLARRAGRETSYCTHLPPPAPHGVHATHTIFLYVCEIVLFMYYVFIVCIGHVCSENKGADMSQESFHTCLCLPLSPVEVTHCVHVCIRMLQLGGAGATLCLPLGVYP